MWKTWHPIKPLTSSVGKQFCCVDVYRSDSLVLPIVVLLVYRITESTFVMTKELCHYKERAKYAKCHFSQDDNDVIESSDPSRFFFFMSKCAFFIFSGEHKHSFQSSRRLTFVYCTPTFLFPNASSAFWVVTVLPPFRLSVPSVMDFLRWGSEGFSFTIKDPLLKIH